MLYVIEMIVPQPAGADAVFYLSPEGYWCPAWLDAAAAGYATRTDAETRIRQIKAQTPTVLDHPGATYRARAVVTPVT